MDPNRHDIDHILKLPTPRLLNYYKNLRKKVLALNSEYEQYENTFVSCDENAYLGNWYDEESGHPFSLMRNLQQFNTMKMDLKAIKAELSSREHVLSKSK